MIRQQLTRARRFTRAHNLAFKHLVIVPTMLLMVGLSGCFDNENPTQPQPDSSQELSITNAPGINASWGHGMITYQVTIENLTTGQPMSPPVAATHRPWTRMFQVGRRASSQIEAIAEDGNQIPMVEFLGELNGVTEVVDVGMPLTRHGTTVGDFVDHASFEIKARYFDRFSIATMLICTNDGFTGLNSVRLPRHGSRVYYLKGYDAGTEYNTEQSADIVDACSALGAVSLPGDPDGNENDAVDSSPHRRIRRHAGIKGEGELTRDSHGWDNPVAKVTITRVDEPVLYSVKIENITSGQPFSPPVVATHTRDIQMFKVGGAASAGLEAIAEDGNQIPMFERFAASDAVTQVVDIGRPLTPHGTTVGDFTDHVEFQIEAARGDRLSMGTMLICTNDGFTGLNTVRLPRHGYRVFYLKGYDAGTEENTEQSSDIVDACSGLGPVALPGDPNGNENGAVDTQPRERIRRHRGIHGEGELSSGDHGWHGPVAKVTVKRIFENSDDE